MSKSKKHPSLPTPRQLLRQAEREEQKLRPRLLGDYKESIQALRGKDFTWKEIGEWLAARGMSYSLNQIRNVTKQ